MQLPGAGQALPSGAAVSRFQPPAHRTPEHAVAAPGPDPVLGPLLVRPLAHAHGQVPWVIQSDYVGGEQLSVGFAGKRGFC